MLKHYPADAEGPAETFWLPFHRQYQKAKPVHLRRRVHRAHRVFTVGRGMHLESVRPRLDRRQLRRMPRYGRSSRPFRCWVASSIFVCRYRCGFVGPPGLTRAAPQELS